MRSLALAPALSDARRPVRSTSRVFALAAAAGALALLAAGCVSPPPTNDETTDAASAADPATWDAIRALVGDAPCETDVSASETSANLVPLGSTTTESGHYGEMDIRGELIALGAGQQLDIVDISDPRAPTIVSSLPLEVSTADVKWLPGMDAIVIGAYEGALVIVDTTNLANPVIAGSAEVATQAHMVQPAVLGDKVYVYVASQTGNQPAFVYEMEGLNATLVGAFGIPVLNSGPGLGNHDIAIVNDTLLEKPILYLADGLAGWSAWSLDDPVHPERIGLSIGQEAGAGYVHTVRVGFFDGKRIVATMQEVGQNTLKIYDATNLDLPILLARWNADPTRPTIPQHNIQLLDTWLFMGHYTEGFYAFNLSAVIAGPPLLGTLELAPAAHWAVDEQAEGGPLGFANVWDVAVRRGVVYASDIGGKLDAVAFSCLALGDDAASATL